MSYMIMDVELDNDFFAQLEGSHIKLWQGTGLPVYVGTLDNMRSIYPVQFQELLSCKVIRSMSAKGAK